MPISHFHYRNGRLHADRVDLAELAGRVGTPCYVYARAAIEARWRAFDEAFGAHPHQVCYAVKANSNLAVLNILARLGSGFDIVSGGELERVLQAGGDPSKIVYSGVGKSVDEMRRALEVGIYCFNIESEAELERLNAVASEAGVRAPMALRVNPDIDAGSHPYIATGLKESKFGIDIGQALVVYQRAARLPHVEVIGIDCHIGSQLAQLPPLIAAVERMLALARHLELVGVPIRHIDMGGGLGIRYRDETPPEPGSYVAALLERLRDEPYKILIEPGRAIVGAAGVLLTRIEYLKHASHRNFAIVDAGMNDLLRPALYNAWQDIVEVQPRTAEPAQLYDVVGPVCETGDFLGRHRQLRVHGGDLLAICATGAYGAVMSSNYNSRPRAAEVVADGDVYYVVRQRQPIAALWAGEEMLPP
jgi:diaminopimelate decarboxylase